MKTLSPILIGLGFVLVGPSAVAQLRSPEGIAPSSDGQGDDQTFLQQRQTLLDANSSSQPARSSVGQIGQRQTRDIAAQQAGVKPMARIANRIENRVQNRVRNRIDRNYETQANATDPFIAVDEQIRKSGITR